MKLIHGQELPPSVYMFWCWAADPKKNPFTFFENKYGYSPTIISVGSKVDIDIPEGIDRAEKNICTIPGHIKLR